MNNAPKASALVTQEEKAIASKPSTPTGDGPPLETTPASAVVIATYPYANGRQSELFLMGLLLRQYERHWKDIYGHQLPRRTFIMDRTR